MEKMLSHLSEESKQAAATTLVSPPSLVPALGGSSLVSQHSCPETRGFSGTRFSGTTNLLMASSTAHQRGRPVPHLLRTPHLSHLQTLLPQVLQVSSSQVTPPSQGLCQPLAPHAVLGRGLCSFLLSPRACINQHLMNNKDCFFCKATITGVDDFTKPASS